MIPLVLFVTWLVSSGTGLLIGNVAHFGGFLVGVIYGLYLKNKYPKKTKMISDHFSH
jgi:membrane associated rhomboid family serine protease